MDTSGAVNSASRLIRQCQSWVEIKLGAGHPFDDKHDAGAGWAAQLNVSGGPIRAGRFAEQLAAARKCGFPLAVGEESEVADANQAAGQDVKQETAQELDWKSTRL